MEYSSLDWKTDHQSTFKIYKKRSTLTNISIYRATTLYLRNLAWYYLVWLFQSSDHREQIGWSGEHKDRSVAVQFGHLRQWKRICRRIRPRRKRQMRKKGQIQHQSGRSVVLPIIKGLSETTAKTWRSMIELVPSNQGQSISQTQWRWQM